MSSYAPVTAFVRGLDVLHALNTLGGKAGVGAVHELTRIPKPTIVRILETLIHTGYVARSAVGKNYGLTAKCLALSGGFDAYDYLLRQAAPVLDAVRRRMVWPSDLAVLDRNAMAIIETSRQPGVLSFNRTVGSRVPALTTAIGRAYLAHAKADVRARVLAELASSDDPFDALAKTPERAQAMLDVMRAQGFATSDREHMNGVRAIAYPIFFNGDVLAAVNVFVVVEAMSLEQLIERYAPVLGEAVRDIELALQGGREAPSIKGGNLPLTQGISH